MPNNYYSSLGIDTAKLASLLDEINKIDTLKDEANDLIGRVYEYFLSKFAIAEGKGKGEFYTPKSIVNLIAELIQPYEGKIYDPCCGSGGMFVQSLKFVDAHHGNRKNVSVYGQEYTKTTYNYGWILNMVSKLSTNGVAGFILANGALSSDGTEKAIRQKMLERGLVEAIIILPRKLFYSTDISVSLWVLNANKKQRVVSREGEEVHLRDREREVLFIDLRQKGEPYEKKFVQLSTEVVRETADLYHRWQQEGAEPQDFDRPGYSYPATFADIKRNDYSLVPSKYIRFDSQDSTIDYDTQMRQLQGELRDLLQQEGESRRQLLQLFDELGYKIELS